MADARRGQFDVVLVWAFDRVARSVKHFLEVLDELNHLNVEFVIGVWIARRTYNFTHSQEN